MRSVCVTLTPCDFSIAGISFSRVAFNADASTSRATKKCGTVVQLCVVRSAMIRPMDDTAPPAVTGPDEGAAGAGVGLAEAAVVADAEEAEEADAEEAAFR